MSEKLDFTINPDKWTLGDLEDFEDLTGGKSFQETFKGKPVLDDETGKPVRDKRGQIVREIEMSAKTMVAVVFIEMRRKDPDFTIEAARQVEVGQFNIDGGDDESPES
jgi:hypothetical protein